jgi:hypothetical protein
MMNDELYEQFEKDCGNLKQTLTDALFVAWGKGYLSGKRAVEEQISKEIEEEGGE